MAASDKGTKAAKGLAKGADPNHIASGSNIQQFKTAATMLTEHTKGMGLIHQ